MALYIGAVVLLGGFEVGMIYAVRVSGPNVLIRVIS